MVVEPNIMATQQVRIEEQPIYGWKQWIFAPSWAEKKTFFGWNSKGPQLAKLYSNKFQPNP